MATKEHLTDATSFDSPIIVTEISTLPFQGYLCWALTLVICNTGSTALSPKITPHLAHFSSAIHPPASALNILLTYLSCPSAGVTTLADTTSPHREHVSSAVQPSVVHVAAFPALLTYFSCPNAGIVVLAVKTSPHREHFSSHVHPSSSQVGSFASLLTTATCCPWKTTDSSDNSVSVASYIFSHKVWVAQDDDDHV